jgi:hypothetical protein
MKKFQVELKLITTEKTTVEVEAENEILARDKARKIGATIGTDWDLDDQEIEVQDVIEL